MTNVESIRTVKLPYNKVGYVKNPLLVPTEIPTREAFVSVGTSSELANIATGEIEQVTRIMTRKMLDTEPFAKVYIAGVAAAFDLNRTAQRVFSLVLQMLPKNKDFIYLSYMAVDGKGELPMTEQVFMRGLKELLAKRFIAHADEPNKFWTNSHLFHNGDRVQFLTEYVKNNRTERIKKTQDKALSAIDELEEIGQQRLVD